MFVPTLLETRRPLASRGTLGGEAVSFVIHSAILVGAVYGTLNVRSLETVGRLIVDMPLFQQTAPPPPALPTLVAPPVGFTTIAIPTDIPTVIPPPSQVAFDPARYSGIGLEIANPRARDTTTRTVRAETVYSTAMLEELPERIAGSDPRYPDLLRNAGIGGQVRIEFVIDTAGRVEAGSVRIVSSTHELFSEAARAAVSTWRFRPGRVEGTAVRSWVQVPLEFVK